MCSSVFLREKNSIKLLKLLTIASQTLARKVTEQFERFVLNGILYDNNFKGVAYLITRDLEDFMSQSLSLR